MCQLSEAYCTGSPSTSALVQSSDIALNSGITYNFMVVATQSDSFPLNITSSTHQFKLASGQSSITLGVNTHIESSETPLKIIIVPIITLRVPFRRDIFGMVYEYSGDDDDDNSTYAQYHDCLNASTKIFARFDCSLIRRFYYIKYTIGNNCLMEKRVSSTPRENDPPPPQSLSPLTWFHLVAEAQYNSVNDRSFMIGLIMTQMGVSTTNGCGKRWYEVLMASGIEQMKCNEFAPIYFDMKPFVRLSLHAIVAKLNLVIKQGLLESNETHVLHDLIIANDLLVRHCEGFNDEVVRNATIYDSLIQRLEVFNREEQENTLMLCASLISLSRQKNTSSSPISSPPPLPYPLYLYQYPTWYFQLLSGHILYYAGYMELRSILFVLFLVTCVVVCLLLSTFSLRSMIRSLLCIKRVK
jgi:hypothetical protein